ncbi:hypothetical protein QCA50_014262 [Cerrena zonata]|uniref:Uncharacterized protein n=1 Tax=Cerrena zonata TaxID=2478898 RepID=A0AAW0FQW6_9APHY
MSMNKNQTQHPLTQLLTALGDEAVELLIKYRDETYAPRIVAIQPDQYSVDNAEQWIRIDAFQDWIDEYMQRAHTTRKGATPVRSQPATPSRSRSTSTAPTPSHSRSATSTASTPGSRHSVSKQPRTTLVLDHIPPPIFEISDSKDDSLPKPKRPQNVSVKSEPNSDVIVISDDDEVTFVDSPPAPLRLKLEDSIAITRQRCTKKIITLTSVPRCWDVP